MKWIPIEEQQPEKYQKVCFIISSKDASYDGDRVGGKYIGEEYGFHAFSTPGMLWKGTHWIPMPDESPDPVKEALREQVEIIESEFWEDNKLEPALKKAKQLL